MRKITFDEKPELVVMEGKVVRINFDVEEKEISVSYGMEGDGASERTEEKRTVYDAYVVRLKLPVTEAEVKNAIMAAGMKDEEATDLAYEAVRAIASNNGLGATKDSVIAKITEYDASSAVNAFYLNGVPVWLDKATRVGLMNSTTIAKTQGKEITTLWLGKEKIVVGCDVAIGLLSRLEMYALECFNVTAAHKKAVGELETVEEVLAYDYKQGYPEKLDVDF